jgi:GntR family transcriptional repressor for pyruvate dehydrogenase complex
MIRPSIISGEGDAVKVSGVLRPIEAQTLVDKAAEEIKRQIDDGHFRVGDQLPPERELVRQLGISRTVLREALSTLEALGFIERRSTRGRFVGSGGSGPRSRALVGAWLHQHAAEIAEIDEVRGLIEAHALSDARLGDVSDVIPRLRLLLLDQEDAIARGDVSRAAAADTEFHKLVCSMTRNTTLLDLATALIDRSRNMSLAAYAIPESAQAGLDEHVRVVEALVAGDVAGAAQLLGDHISASSARNVQAGEPSAGRSRARTSRRPNAAVGRVEPPRRPEAPPIQIEQRVPRCARCGKMINVRGMHVEAEEDGKRLLFCSELCQDEFGRLVDEADSVQTPAPSGTGRA